MFKLSARSKKRLADAHPDLRAVIERAIQITMVDFTVLEVKRSLTRQKELVAAGSSWTLDSRHLPGKKTKLVHAADLGAYVNGSIDWAWPNYYVIAKAVQQAARELSIPIRWGGVWDRQLTSSDVDPAVLSAEYIIRRYKAGRKPNADGPHFELPKKKYPG